MIFFVDWRFFVCVLYSLIIQFLLDYYQSPRFVYMKFFYRNKLLFFDNFLQTPNFSVCVFDTFFKVHPYSAVDDFCVNS